MKVKLNDIEVVVVEDNPDRDGCENCVFSQTHCPTLNQELEAGLAKSCVGGEHHYEAA